MANKEDIKAFAKHIVELKKQTYAELSYSDFKHLKKVIWINRLCCWFGYLLAWIIPNPISMFLISLSKHGKWTIVAHHVCHGGYNKVPNTPKRYLSKNFAMGWRKYIDWFDWFSPKAWSYEHNVMHHFHTNEKSDPDFVALQLDNVRKSRIPKFIKAIWLPIAMIRWKFSYFSLNTLISYHKKFNEHSTKKIEKKFYIIIFFKHYLAYILFQFLFIPLLFLPLGWEASLFVLINVIGAEALTNMHSFLTIIPNHTGKDLVSPLYHHKNKEEYYYNQLLTSVNYTSNGFWADYLQGYLNYQIEHHLFPDLPVSVYPRLQPKIQKLCHQYNLPYKIEPIYKRWVKTFRVILGDDDVYFYPSGEKLQGRNFSNSKNSSGTPT